VSVVAVEEKGPVTIVRINRPEKMNAINKAVAIELQEAFALFDRFDAARAYQAGLANRIVSNGSEIEEAVALAAKPAELAPLPLAAMKRFVNDGVLPKGPAELAARVGAELAAVRNSADAAEGVRAFKERRKPRYEGR
jgi:enoyl-CoA hydratase/carnithine racemase